MALRSWTVREALEEANLRLTPLQTDARLDGAQRALVGELLQANTLALGALRPDNTIVAGQRGARAQQIEDKMFALDNVEAAHDAELGPETLYAAMDLAHDAATAIRAGLPSFLSGL